MNINYGGNSLELTPNNSLIVRYRNDILNGVYIDVSDTDYAFISAHDAGWDTVEQALVDDGVRFWDEEDCMAEGEMNYSEAPHLYVMNSVARLVVAEATRMCEEASEL